MITLDKIKKIREKTNCNADTARKFLYSCYGDVSKAITSINRKAVETAIVNHFGKISVFKKK
tara:strand:+ start:47 stop:232 length:186 start_codon:yes stop_codon:yes gene_type:complete